MNFFALQLSFPRESRERKNFGGTTTIVQSKRVSKGAAALWPPEAIVALGPLQNEFYLNVMPYQNMRTSQREVRASTLHTPMERASAAPWRTVCSTRYTPLVTLTQREGKIPVFRVAWRTSS